MISIIPRTNAFLDLSNDEMCCKMSSDALYFSPCGSGKKYKFCCGK